MSFRVGTRYYSTIVLIELRSAAVLGGDCPCESSAVPRGCLARDGAESMDVSKMEA